MTSWVPLQRSGSNWAWLGAAALTVGGWVLVSTGAALWLWALAIAALTISCVAARNWKGAAWRLGTLVGTFVAFPLVLNAAVYALDAAGIVDRDPGGTEPAQLR